MHPQTPTRYSKKFSQRYEVPGLHPHKFRHTSANLAITNGADVVSVSERLGHSDAAVTLRRRPSLLYDGLHFFKLFLSCLPILAGRRKLQVDFDGHWRTGTLKQVIL